MDNQIFKTRVEFSNTREVEEFTNICLQIPEDVVVKGFDEHGHEWSLSAKSLFCSLVMSAKLQHHREHNAHEVDWNTVYVECERDIYNLISKFAI